MDLCVTPVCCNFKVMLIFFTVFQFLSFQFSYNQRKPLLFQFLTRQNMPLHVTVYNAQFIKTCKAIYLASFQVFASRSLLLRVVMLYDDPEEQKLVFVPYECKIE